MPEGRMAVSRFPELRLSMVLIIVGIGPWGSEAASAAEGPGPETPVSTPAESGSSNDKGSGDEKLPEVVVTAEKRTESVQSIPMSVQVISGQTLTDENH